MKIIVNGQTVTFSGDTLTYDEISTIAGIDPSYGPSMTYCDNSHNIGGIIHRGQRITVEEGMIFNVGITGNA